MNKRQPPQGKTRLGKPLKRLWAIVEALLEGPRKREELATICASEPRDPSSVTRDINALRDLGWAIESRGGGPYSLDPSSVPLLVSPAEARALMMMAGVAAGGGFPDGEVLHSLIARIPPGIRRLGEGDADLVVPAAVVDYSKHAEKIGAIRRARHGGRQMKVLYQHPLHDDPSEFLVDASELSWIEGTLILFAYCPEAPGESDGFKTREFRVDRMRSVDVTGNACIRSSPPRFPFSYSILPDLARSFCPPHGHRLVEERTDGSRVFRANANSLLRARRYLLAFGDQAEALEPVSLRKDLATQAAVFARLYHL